ncbi:MAG: ABC transporter ATP-binding protein [Spirochaetales bacterium]|nr:ABC transporter ATP-binding protein [Spirochaetales bacterium]
MPPKPPMNRDFKEKMNFGVLKKIVLYNRRYLLPLLLALVFAVTGSVATIIGPRWINSLMDIITSTILTGIDLDAVFRTSGTLAVIYGIGAIVSYGQQFITATITQGFSRNLRADISRKVNRIPLGYFDTTTKGEILSTVTNDVDTISQALSSSTANLISSAALFVGVLYMMFRVNWILSLLTIGTSVLGFIGMSTVMGANQKHFTRRQQDIAVLSGQIEEVYTNHQIVRIFGGKQQESARFAGTNDRIYDSNWKAQFLSRVMHYIMMFTGNLSYVAIFIVGVVFIVRGNTAVTLGTIMSFTIYSRLFSQPLQTFAQSMSSFQQASAAGKRVFTLLEQQELSDESAKTARLDNPRGDVSFRNVRFGYSPDREIIHDFSAELHSGQKVAIVGPTGAGKTTLVNLLMRFYETDGGDILIDGVSIRDMKRSSLHDLFDMILQDTWLFCGTIRENLIYNGHDVPDEKLDEVCRAVGLNHFIDTLPQRYDTVIDDNLSLSEGQKQQLTIARAMIRNAPLLILDEATSSVDTRTELVIQQSMDTLMAGRTSFVIAHRLSTIRNADIILVLRDGDIVEQGTHPELLEKGGFYAELYNSQFETA